VRIVESFNVVETGQAGGAAGRERPSHQKFRLQRGEERLRHRVLQSGQMQVIQPVDGRSGSPIRFIHCAGEHSGLSPPRLWGEERETFEHPQGRPLLGACGLDGRDARRSLPQRWSWAVAISRDRPAGAGGSGPQPKPSSTKFNKFIKFIERIGGRLSDCQAGYLYV
jgi:hypothetical protein